MPIKKLEEKGPAKVMTYQIKKDVLNAIELLMKREPSLNTMHKAIDYCIIHHFPIIECLSKTEEKYIALEQDRDFYKDATDSLISGLRLLDKQLKKSKS